jgi:cobalt-zinc-cadmium efflux system outer membrane protein
MSTRFRACAWLAAAVLAPPPAFAQDRPARDVIDLIVRDGPRAAAIRAESEVVRAEQLARLAYPNPEVSFTVEGAGFTSFAMVEQPLAVFGIRGALSRAGAAASAAADAERDARLWALRADAAAAVSAVTFAEARLDAAQAHARDVERLIEILRTREREGEGSRFDRLRAEQELRDTQQVALTATVDAAEARGAVIAMLPAGVTLGRVIAAPAPGTAPSLDKLLARALATRPELRALASAAERAGLEVEAVKRSRLRPSLTGGVKRADTEAGRDTGAVVGFAMSLPVFDNGDRESARWTAERARAQAARASIEQHVRAEITRASESLSARRAAAAADPPSAGDDLMRMAEVAYREGEAGILELLDAVRVSARARMRSLELQRDARAAEIALERAVGEVLWP